MFGRSDATMGPAARVSRRRKCELLPARNEEGFIAVEVVDPGALGAVDF